VVAEYEPRCAKPEYPAIDAALMIFSPVPCRRICSADAVHDAENVDPEQCLEVLRSGLEQELDLGDPGVVDEDVDAAELARDPLEPEDGVAVGDVGRDRDRPAAEGADLLGHLLGTFGVNVVDGDVGPVGGQPERDGPADSPRRAGDDGLLPVDAAHGHLPPGGCVVGW
jgi:hypothetical protein